MKKNVLITIIILANLSVFCQSISNVEYKFVPENNQVLITYKVSDLQYYRYLYVNLFVSTDNGSTFKGPLKYVSGDVGNNIIKNGTKQIDWDVFKEYHELKGDVKFEVKATIKEIPRPRIWYVGYNYSSSSPLGLSVGRLNKTSLYAAVKADMKYLKNSNLETYSTFVDNYNEPTQYYKFEDDAYYRRMSAIGGFNFQLHWNWHMYLGFGYGVYQGLWNYKTYNSLNQETDSKYVIIDNHNYTGLDLEAGLRVNIKNKVLLSAGVNTMFNKDNFEPVVTEYTIGVGLIFDKKEK